MKKNSMIITNIQRMCMHDGPGIRTTVFFKGCNLKCPWCCNPENISFDIQQYYSGINEYGKEYSQDAIYEEIIKDEEFYRYTGGGVTFSGGEPLLHLCDGKRLLDKLKEKSVDMAIETALQVPKNYLEYVVDYIDYFIVDIKILDPHICQVILGGNLEVYFDNLKLLEQKHKQVLFRIPCNMEYTLKKENVWLICNLLNKYPNNNVEIFTTHSMGNTKRSNLGLKEIKFEKVSDLQMERIKKILSENTNAQVKINNW